LRTIGEQTVVERGIPFIQSLAAEVAGTHVQDGGETRNLVEFRSSAAGFPMAYRFVGDVQCGGQVRLLQP
jgi:hypothetical protein